MIGDGFGEIGLPLQAVLGSLLGSVLGLLAGVLGVIHPPHCLTLNLFNMRVVHPFWSTVQHGSLQKILLGCFALAFAPRSGE